MLYWQWRGAVPWIPGMHSIAEGGGRARGGALREEPPVAPVNTMDASRYSTCCGQPMEEGGVSAWPSLALQMALCLPQQSHCRSHGSTVRFLRPVRVASTAARTLSRSLPRSRGLWNPKSRGTGWKCAREEVDMEPKNLSSACVSAATGGTACGEARGGS